MSASENESDPVVETLSCLTTAMERLQTRYEASERTARNLRIILILVLGLLGAVAYQALSPVAQMLDRVAEPRPAALDPAVAAAQREQLLRMLPADERARIERFEQQQRWVSSYLAANPEFHTGPAIALVLSQMAQSVQVMPTMVGEVRSMTGELRAMNAEVRAMSDQIGAIDSKMYALPLMAGDIHAMHGNMSVMVGGMDSTMGRMRRMGRMFPWGW